MVYKYNLDFTKGGSKSPIKKLKTVPNEWVKTGQQTQAPMLHSFNPT